MLVIDIMLSRAITIQCDDHCLSCLVTIMSVIHFLVFIDGISTNIMVSLAASGLLYLKLVYSCRSVCLLVFLSNVVVSNCISVLPSACPPAHPSICLSVWLVCLSCRSVSPYDSGVLLTVKPVQCTLSASMPAYLSAYPSDSLHSHQIHIFVYIGDSR